MDDSINIKPIRIWHSLVLFLGPGLYGVFAFYVLFPILVQRGMPEEFAYGTQMLTVFILLLILTGIGLRKEGQPLIWKTCRDRLRLQRMDSRAWKWTLGFTFLWLLAGLLLNILGQYVLDKVGFISPDAHIALTNIPFLVLVLGFNVIAEEVWWRGYILPRQELEHGRYAFLVNGILWSFFHLFKWWAIPLMVLRDWLVPFVVQRTKNTTPGLIMHFISNGISVAFSVIAITAQ